MKGMIRKFMACSVALVALSGCIKSEKQAAATAETSLVDSGMEQIPPIVILDPDGHRVIEGGHDNLANRDGVSDLPPYNYIAPPPRETRYYRGGGAR